MNEFDFMTVIAIAFHLWDLKFNELMAIVAHLTKEIIA